MKKLLLITLTIFAVQFSSCKKEESPATSTIQTITEYLNGRVVKKYVYSPNSLMQYQEFNYDGSVTDSVKFFYTGNRLDSLYTYNLSSGEKYLTSYLYSNNKLMSITKNYRNSSKIQFDIEYNNFNRIGSIIYFSATLQPFKGQYVMNSYGNLEEYTNEYVASIYNENFESNLFAYNQSENVLQSFWLIDPINNFISINLPVEQIQNTSATNDGSTNPNSNWHYKTSTFKFDYTFYEDGNVMTKSVLDTGNVVLNTYSYEYEISH